MEMDRLAAEKQPVQIFIQANKSIVLTFDATIEELHEGESDVTDYPVEEGADHTDHVRSKPQVFAMKGMVTDFPIIVDLPNNKPENKTGQDSGSRVGDAYGFLDQARLDVDLVQVFTRLRTYQSMVIRKVTLPRTARDGQSGVFNIQFRQITFGEVEITKAPKPVNPSRNAKQDKGKKATDEADTSAGGNKSLLKSGKDALFGRS